jgi:hypothetical protein
MSIYTNGYWANGTLFIGTTSVRNTISTPTGGINIYPWTADEAEYSRQLALLLRPFEPLTYNKAQKFVNIYGRYHNVFMLSGKSKPCIAGQPCPLQPMPDIAKIKLYLTYKSFMNWFLYVDTLYADSTSNTPLDKVFQCPLGDCEEAAAQYLFHRLKTGNTKGVKYIDPVTFRQKLKDPAFLAPTFPGSGVTIKKVPTPKKPAAKPAAKTKTIKKPLTKLKGK